MEPLGLAETLAILAEGFLRVRPPLAPHLFRDPAVHLSSDWFATSREIPLEPDRPGALPRADLPAPRGGEIQYRFAAAHRFEPRVAHLDNLGRNHAFRLPERWGFRPLAPEAETLFSLLESGAAVAVPAGALPGIEAPCALYNLLGPAAHADALRRARLPRALPLLLAHPARFDAFFAGEGAFARPTAFFSERIADPAFPLGERLRAERVREGSPLAGALALLDSAHHFPLCGALPLPAETLPADAGDAPALLAGFFATWLDALVADGLLVLRDATKGVPA